MRAIQSAAMRALSGAIFLLICAVSVLQVFGEQSSGLHLHYSLTEGSSIFLFPRNRPPRFERALSGTFDVVVKERFEGGFVFEITELQFRSIEDDLYEIETDRGVLSFNNPEINLDLRLLVRRTLATDREDVYGPAMTGPNRQLLATTWPPVFQNLILVGSHSREPY
jgi:hypothetical protein